MSKESCFYYEFDGLSDAYNPVFKDRQIVFNGINASDDSSFILLILFEIKKGRTSLEFVNCGVNIVPLMTAPDTIVNGVFEMPLVEVDLSPEVFTELNAVNPWQFQYRCIKEKKVKDSSVRVVYRQCNADLVVVWGKPRTCMIPRLMIY